MQYSTARIEREISANGIEFDKVYAEEVERLVG